jgi:hypothetical protein
MEVVAYDGNRLRRELRKKGIAYKGNCLRRELLKKEIAYEGNGNEMGYKWNGLQMYTGMSIVNK